MGEFPWRSAVGTLHVDCRNVGLIPAWELRSPRQVARPKKISYWMYLLEIIENIYWPPWKGKTRDMLMLY